MDANTNLDIHDIDRGKLVARINEALAKAMADIADPNKEATKKRTVMVSITFSPSKSRREASCAFNVTLKPAGHVEFEPSTIYLGKAEDGTIIGKPYVPNQQILPGVDDALNIGQEDN